MSVCPFQCVKYDSLDEIYQMAILSWGFFSNIFFERGVEVKFRFVLINNNWCYVKAFLRFDLRWEVQFLLFSLSAREFGLQFSNKPFTLRINLERFRSAKSVLVWLQTRSQSLLICFSKAMKDWGEMVVKVTGQAGKGERKVESLPDFRAAFPWCNPF